MEEIRSQSMEELENSDKEQTVTELCMTDVTHTLSEETAVCGGRLVIVYAIDRGAYGGLAPALQCCKAMTRRNVVDIYFGVTM